MSRSDIKAQKNQDLWPYSTFWRVGPKNGQLFGLKIVKNQKQVNLNVSFCILIRQINNWIWSHTSWKGFKSSNPRIPVYLEPLFINYGEKISAKDKGQKFKSSVSTKIILFLQEKGVKFLSKKDKNWSKTSSCKF